MIMSSITPGLREDDQQRFFEILSESDKNPKRIRKFLETIAYRYIDVDNESLHTCTLPICSSAYRTKNTSDARRHFFGHFPEGFQQCDFCHHRTSQITNLRNHMRTQHPTEKHTFAVRSCRPKNQNRPSQAYKRQTTNRVTPYPTDQTQVKLTRRRERTDNASRLAGVVYLPPSPIPPYSPDSQYASPSPSVYSYENLQSDDEKMFRFLDTSAFQTGSDVCNQPLDHIPFPESPFDSNLSLISASRYLGYTEQSPWNSSLTLPNNECWPELDLIFQGFVPR